MKVSKCIAFLIIGSALLCYSGNTGGDNGPLVRSDSVFGVNAHMPDDQTLVMADGAGIGWLRLDISWRNAEPENDVYNWDFYDQRINAAADMGFSILLTVSGTPVWASAGGNVNDSPEDAGKWEEFMTAAADSDIRYPG